MVNGYPGSFAYGLATSVLIKSHFFDVGFTKTQPEGKNFNPIFLCLALLFWVSIALVTKSKR